MHDVVDDLIAFPDRRAAEVAGVSRGRLLYWDLTHVVRPGIQRRLSVRNVVRLYTFQETVSLLVVAQLRERGLPLQTVRKVVAHLRDRGYAAPLSELRFATAGREIYFQHPDGSWEGAARADQLVLHEVLDLELIRQIVRAGAARPRADYGRTERRRKTKGNRLVFAGTRIPVETVVRWIEGG
ncbi:MAG TPA: MerR family transcriptional regulator, partial [Asanoa sp.]|nr:MerR family transcriptional regulator [Asanoa sp.]